MFDMAKFKAARAEAERKAAEKEHARVLRKRPAKEKEFSARINRPAVTVEKLPSGMYVFTYKNGQRLFARGPIVTHIMEGIPYNEIEVTK